MITIFSTPRPFEGEFRQLQRNAIASWTRLAGDCQIILVEDEAGTTRQVAEEFGVEYLGQYRRNENATPLLDDVFDQVLKRAKYDVVAHINADIILFPNFVELVGAISRLMPAKPFLLLGRRWDIALDGPLNVDEVGWDDKLLDKVRAEGKLHGPAGMDYWIFPKSACFRPLAFCVGRPGMDSWLVFDAKSRGIPVVDATDAVAIVHQAHGYPKKRASYFEEECARNVSLAGGRGNMLTLREADWVVQSDMTLAKPPLPRLLLSFLSGFAAWRNLLAAKRSVQRILAGSSR